MSRRSDAAGFLAKTLDNIEGQDWEWTSEEVQRLIRDTLELLGYDA